MFGFQTSSATEAASAANMLLTALADPEAAKTLLASINEKIDEFTKMRDAAFSAQQESEKRAAEANTALADAKRIANLNGADRVSLDQALTTLQYRVDDVTARENALSETAAKIDADAKSHRAKLDADRAEFENAKAAGLQEVQNAKAVFDSFSDQANKEIKQKLADTDFLRNKAAQDAQAAADLKAKWEAKVAAANAMAQALSKSE